MTTTVGKIKVTRRIMLCAFGAFVITAAVAAGSCYYSVDNKENKIVKKEVVIEAGTKIRIEDFFSGCPIDAKFITDISGIDTDIPAIYKLTVSYENAIKEDVTLKIEDHKGPEGRPVPHTVYTTWKMPDAKECVEDLYDLSGIAIIEYKGGTPVFRSEGTYEVPVVVTDKYGNDTVIDVPFKIINDRTAPVIDGVHDIESDGDTSGLDLLEGITVTDDHDKDPVIRVNDSMVNYKESGEYEITYSAIDKAGNISTVKAKITVSIDDEDDSDDYYYYDGSDAYEMAASIMNSLWRSNDVETARAIFDWVHSHVCFSRSVTFSHMRKQHTEAFPDAAVTVMSHMPVRRCFSIMQVFPIRWLRDIPFIPTAISGISLNLMVNGITVMQRFSWITLICISCARMMR